MTASPTAISSSPSKTAEGGNALAALFAAAAANSMHRQMSSPTTRSSATSKTISINNNIECRSNDNAAAAAMFASITSKSSPKTSSSMKQKRFETSETKDIDSANSAAQLIASLLSSSPGLKQKSASSPSKSSINASINESLKNCQSSPTSAAKPIERIMKHETANKTPVETSPSMLDKAKKFSKQSPKMETKLIKSERETKANNSVELRNLETWHDEDENRMDESCYQELVDLGNTNGWSADEMFEYNEKRHKITSSYNEKTLGDKYTTPLSKNKSKTTVRMAVKLAKEIEDKLQADGRVTPESSDDDEEFELERARRIQLKQQKQLEQLKALKAVNSLSIHSQNGRSSQSYNPHVDLGGSSHSSDGSSTSTSNGHKNKTNNRRSAPISNHNHVASRRRVSNKSSSQQSNSSATPVTASLSSSPTLNDSINIGGKNNKNNHHHLIKPVTSSSRNILRTCLT